MLDHGRRQRETERGRVPSSLWTVTRDINRGLIVLFFGLFSVAPLPAIFSADALIRSLIKCIITVLNSSMLVIKYMAYTFMGVGSGGGASPPWIFIHGMDIVDKGLDPIYTWHTLTGVKLNNN